MLHYQCCAGYFVYTEQSCMCHDCVAVIGTAHVMGEGGPLSMGAMRNTTITEEAEEAAHPTTNPRHPPGNDTPTVQHV